MAHLGERLRQQRLSKSVSLQDISEQTRIGVRYLEALEAGDFKQLPGAIFARSFVRQYAEIVGTNVSSLESELQQIFPSDEAVPSTVVASSPLSANLKSDTLLAADGPVWKRLPLTTISLTTALIISSLLYVGWQRVVLHNETSEVAPAQQTAKPPSSKPTQPAVNADPPRPSLPTVVPAAVTTPGPPAPAKSPNELQAPPGTGGPMMALRVVASAETWVSIAANGQFVFSGILQPYEERTVTGVERARMVIGNSAGVDVLAEGRSIGPIGPPGSVRIVVLTPGSPPQISQNADFQAQPQEPAKPQTGNAATPATKLD